MAAALRQAATRLCGGPLRRMQGVQRRMVSSTVAEITRPITEAEFEYVVNWLMHIDEKKEELYSMIADLTKSYKVPRKIAHRNAMLLDQLAAQVQPRPNDQMWRTCRRAQKLDYFLTYVGACALGVGTAHGLRWTIEQIDPEINRRIEVELHRLRDKIMQH